MSGMAWVAGSRSGDLRSSRGGLERMVIAWGAMLVIFGGFIVSAARATTLTTLGSFSGARRAFVTSASSAGALATVEGLTIGDFSSPDSLFALTSSSLPSVLTPAQYTPASAVSSNGRFVTWVVGPCTRVGAGAVRPVKVFVRDMVSGGTSQIALPKRYNRAGFDAISVSATGRVTALVSTYLFDDYCLGSGSDTPRDRDAIISASPGASAFGVIASDPTYGGEGFAVSADRTVFTLCSSFVPFSRRAQLVSVAAGNRFRIWRASVRIRRMSDNFVICGASDSGTAAMLFAPPTGNKAGLLSTGPGGTRAMQLSHAGVPYGNLALSPSGQKTLVLDSKGHPLLVDFLTRRVSQLGVPAALRGWSIYGGAQFVSQADLPAWVASQTVISAPVRLTNAEGPSYMIMIDPITRVWSKVLKLGPVGSATLYCPLQSGRVLFANEVETGHWPYTEIDHLYLSNRARTSAAPIDTSALGPIHAVSCPTGTSSVYISTGNSPAVLEAASHFAIDGSPWVP